MSITERIDTLPYKTWLKLKQKYPTEMVLVTGDAMTGTGVHLAFKNHREMIAHMFKQKGIEVLRWVHDYESLKGAHPQLGVVFLANDSVVVEGYEAWVLIGHNARRTSEVKDDVREIAKRTDGPRG